MDVDTKLTIDYILEHCHQIMTFFCLRSEFNQSDISVMI
ncbi:hypothetical protein HNR38_001017 [Marinobacter oulmenensis]|uniref:Uncharacterized protein n=1 Tax=Marinobacter oulmenensis TaxID=643747 RepID=A0A840UDL9_9GAMM|nr:hypothetical protein [Marinobacter oulmenensis]